MEADFSGYATKAGLKCSDGRTIMPDAFKHQDGQKVPLVWQHKRDEPANVLGHALLENREDGVYAYAFFNETGTAKNAKALVEHGDISFLSIYANKLLEKSKSVLHGAIQEVSLVLAGANPGALIDNVSFSHSDGEIETLEDEAIIYTGLPIEHEDAPTEGDQMTIKDLYETFTEDQKQLVHFMIGAALESNDNTEGSSDSTEHSDDTKSDEDALAHQEGNEMTHNVFETKSPADKTDRPTLTHEQLQAIIEDAKKLGSFKESFLQHAVDYGIENIDFLFPDARTITDSPEFISRRMEWVATVINGTRHSPFSRIKSLSADITHEEARAKGYIKGNLKKEEFFALAKRVTTPTTIYKKQKLDRDDIIDITDLDVVAWLKAEMRVMLDEELARAVLIGDGREVDDEDKINETNIRPVAYDDDFYAPKVVIPANVSGDALVEAIVRARPTYRGSGNPTMFCTEDLLTDLLLVKDKMGRRLYPTQAELQSALRVSNIVTVEVMEDLTTDGGDLLAILVNLNDYTLGADRGGNVSMFDDFDIDYNQYKYLIETRVSGTLTKYRSALVFSRAAGTLVTPTTPTFVSGTGVVTIPTVTGVVYKNQDTDATLSAGAQTALAAGATLSVVAVPSTGYYFAHNFDADWDFTRPSA
jgi:HK97 family phage prohead protease